MKQIFVLILTLVITNVVLSKSIKLVGDPQFEIRTGNCTTAVLSDLVFSKHCHKSRLPFVSREGTETYYGDLNIYCILALSEKDPSKNSTVEITDGGLNHTYATFEMKSAVNHGYEYNLSVYAK